MGNLHSTSQKRLVKKKKFGISTLVIIAFYTLLLTSFQSSNQFSEADKNEYDGNPLTSASVFRRLVISPLNPWDNYPQLANGSGTIEEPYIIENVTFDALDDSCTLMINNSHAYTIIRNCIFINSESSTQGSVFLLNCSNIQIINSKIINNDQTGILIYESSNITLSSNEIERNQSWGIYCNLSSDINISNNVIWDNYNSGIELVLSSHIEIINNSIGCNSIGIDILGSSHNNILSNTISYSRVNSIILELSSYNNITENFLRYNTNNKIIDQSQDPTNHIFINFAVEYANQRPNMEDNTETSENNDNTDENSPKKPSKVSTFLVPLKIFLIIFLLVIIFSVNLANVLKKQNHSSNSPKSSNTTHRLIPKKKKIAGPNSSKLSLSTHTSPPKKTPIPIIINLARYCPHCGTHIPSSSIKILQSESSQVFCHLCGGKIH